MKRVLALVTVCLLLTQFGMSSATDGSTEPEPTPEPEPSSPVQTIVRIVHPALLWQTNLVILERGGNASTLELPTKTACILEGEMDSITAPIEWELNKVNTDKVGWDYVEGRVLLPEGYVCSGCDPILRYRLLVYDPALEGVETIISAATMGSSEYTVPRSTDGTEDGGRKALEEQLKTYALKPATFTLVDDMDEVYTFPYPITYDASMVDLNTAGSYAIFSPPPAYFRLNEVALQTMSIHVLEPDEVDLRGWILDGFGTVTIRWPLKLKEPPEAWVSVDGKAWKNADTLEEDGLLVELPPWPEFPQEDGESGEWGGGEWDEEPEGPLPAYEFTYVWWVDEPYCNRLQIVEPRLAAGHTYEFEVRYGESGYSVNSFLLDLREGRPYKFGNGGGSRGGSDREETETPPVDPGGGSYHPGPVTPDKKPKPPVVAETPPTPTPTPAPVEESPAPEATPAIHSAPPEDTPPVDIAQEDIPPHMSVDEAVTLPPLAEAPPSPTPKIRKSTATVQSPAADVLAEANKEETEPAATMPPPDASPPLPTEERAPQEPPITLDLPPTPAVAEVELPAQAPISGSVAIIVVGGGAALGAAAIWKLLGKRLVKRR